MSPVEILIVAFVVASAITLELLAFRRAERSRRDDYPKPMAERT